VTAPMVATFVRRGINDNDSTLAPSSVSSSWTTTSSKGRDSVAILLDVKEA
jgi:hypothetical protein